MEFKKQTNLLQVGVVGSPNPPIEIEGLMVGEKFIASWKHPYTECDYVYVTVYPALLDGEQAWLVKCVWHGKGFGFSDTHEEILNFDEGVEFLLEHGHQPVWPAE